MPLWQQAFLVGSAGFVGAVTRWMLTLGCAKFLSTRFPIATFFINVSGSFALGWLMAALGQRVVPSEPMRLAIGVGFLGAYTTFSTWMYDCDAMMREGIPMRAMLNLIGSVVLGLLAVRAGFWLAPR